MSSSLPAFVHVVLAASSLKTTMVQYLEDDEGHDSPLILPASAVEGLVVVKDGDQVLLLN